MPFTEQLNTKPNSKKNWKEKLAWINMNMFMYASEREHGAGAELKYEMASVLFAIRR